MFLMIKTKYLQKPVIYFYKIWLNDILRLMEQMIKIFFSYFH